GREPRGDAAGEQLRVERRGERRVHVQTERARRLRLRLQAELDEERPQRQRDARALDETGRRSGIEIEDDLGRLARSLDAPEKRMELDGRLVGEPDERG